MNLITCEKVTVKYDNKTALANVDLFIDEGDYLCIIGENGSGKTSLMKAILKLIPTQGGNILYKNVSPNEIGYLPQQTVVQKDFPASVNEIVLSGCLNKLKSPFFSAGNKKTAEKNMELLGIGDLKKICYRELSGGQQQRVLLARALCSTGKLIFLDEPAVGLDPLVKAEFYALIQKINIENAITVVMVSHDMQGVMQSATKILHLKNKTLFYGTAEEYKNNSISKYMMNGDIL